MGIEKSWLKVWEEAAMYLEAGTKNGRNKMIVVLLNVTLRVYSWILFSLR
jgi:hypothetical protein